MCLPVFFEMSSRWAAEVIINHGSNEAFSTGSHAQYPPKERLSYAQKPPIIMPVPRTPIQAKLQIKAGCIHERDSPFQTAATLYANGTTPSAKPKNKVGG